MRPVETCQLSIRAWKLDNYKCKPYRLTLSPKPYGGYLPYTVGKLAYTVHK